MNPLYMVSTACVLLVLHSFCCTYLTVLDFEGKKVPTDLSTNLPIPTPTKPPTYVFARCVFLANNFKVKLTTERVCLDQRIANQSTVVFPAVFVLLIFSYFKFLLRVELHHILLCLGLSL